MPPHTTCPAPTALQQFLLGLLPDVEAESLEQHLGGCSACLAHVRTLQGQDALTEAMRGQTPLPHEPGPALRKLMERLKHLSGSGTPLEDDAAPESASIEELVAQLAPAQGPQELGRLGTFRLLRVLGQGGMGVVFLAEDTQLHRAVALKAMLPKLAARRSAQQRFLREARLAGAIEHPHIVPIYHVGNERGVPYLVMPLLRGESLAARLQREVILPIPDVLRIGRETALGLAAAHARGLIHRDIKPGNLFLVNGDLASGGRPLASGGRKPPEESTVPDELPASGGLRPPLAPTNPSVVKILDFGLARPLHTEEPLTEEGLVVGTPSYMAPEQARGLAVDARADLFSLGCVLYRACTGRLPFQGRDVMSILTALAVDVPPPPRELNPAVPAGLSNLIVRLLARAPDQRPPSAQAVAEAIAQLERAPQTTQMAAPPQRGWWLAVAAVVLIMGGTIGWLLWHNIPRPELPRGSSTEKEPPANAAVPPLDRLKRADIAEKELAAVGGGDAAKVPAELVALVRVPLAGQEETKALRHLAFSSDGRWLASAATDGVRLWNVASRELRPLPATGATKVVFLPGTNTLVSAHLNRTLDFTLNVWDATTGQTIREPLKVELVRDMVCSPDGQFLFVAGIKEFFGFLTDTWAEKRRIPLANPVDMRLAFHPSGTPLTYATTYEDGNVRFDSWNLTNHNNNLANLKLAPGAKLGAPSFSDDGKLVVLTIADRVYLKAWNERRLAPLDIPARAGALITPQSALIVAADGTRVTIASKNPEEMPRVLEFPGLGEASCLTASPDGRHVAVGFRGGAVGVLRLSVLRG